MTDEQRQRRGSVARTLRSIRTQYSLMTAFFLLLLLGILKYQVIAFLSGKSLHHRLCICFPPVGFGTALGKPDSDKISLLICSFFCRLRFFCRKKNKKRKSHA